MFLEPASRFDPRPGTRRPHPPFWRRRGRLTRQEFVHRSGRRGREQQSQIVFAAEGDRGLDEVADRALPLPLQALPSPERYARSFRHLELRQVLGDPPVADAVAKLLEQFVFCFQHGPNMAPCGLNSKLMRHIWPSPQSAIAPRIVEAMLDQFHTRGILATAELASAAGIKAGDRVLDLGCGIGGPARYLASTLGCKVTGLDLSPSFVEAATYLTARCGLTELVTFIEGDALQLPFDEAALDSVFLQHVAMNISDRAALYGEVHRVLRPKGCFVTYDLVLKEGEVIYPAPWARFLHQLSPQR